LSGNACAVAAPFPKLDRSRLLFEQGIAMRWLIAILVALILILQYRLWVGDGSLAEVYHLKRQIEEQRATLEKLRERNKALQAEVEDLREGLEAVEERARSELGMIKEGEVFYQVIQEPAKRDDKQH